MIPLQFALRRKIMIAGGGGGDALRASGIPYKALAVIEQADENGIIFREED